MNNTERTSFACEMQSDSIRRMDIGKILPTIFMFGFIGLNASILDRYEVSLIASYDQSSDKNSEVISYNKFIETNLPNNNLYHLDVDYGYQITRREFLGKLSQFYRKMKGVKYVFGGEGMNGIDCSALIRKFFSEEFNIQLPRSTHTQIYEGIPINKKELQLGDLIFFKQSNGINNHVGIYIEGGKMLHISSTNGFVAIDPVSKFDNIYWKSRRVLDIRS